MGVISARSALAAASRGCLAVLLLAAACRAERTSIRLLAVMPSEETFRLAWTSMKSDLGNRYAWRTFDPDTRNAEDSISRLRSAYAPSGLVLMDSRAVALVKRMQKRDPAFAALPKFVLMTLRAEEAAQGLENAVGIRFEVPAYAVFTQLRALSKKDFARVGVLHRRNFSAFVEDSRRLLARERLELIGKCVDCDGSAELSGSRIVGRLDKGLDELKAEGVEVVWMLSDNFLVNASTLRQFWVPRFRRGKAPLVVPLAHLAGKQADLGMFSAYPDYPQLGVQAAQQVVRVLEEKAPPSEVGFESLISVQTTFNLGVAKRLGWEVRREKLDRIGDLLPP